MTAQTPVESQRPGVWLIYDYDHGPYAQSIHASAEEAAREAARQGYGRVGFWPLGMELRDAVKAWEDHDSPTGTTAGTDILAGELRVAGRLIALPDVVGSITVRQDVGGIKLDLLSDGSVRWRDVEVDE